VTDRPAEHARGKEIRTLDHPCRRRLVPTVACLPDLGYKDRHFSSSRAWTAAARGAGTVQTASTDGRGLSNAGGRIFDNSVDEALGRYGSRIEVVAHADG